MIPLAIGGGVLLVALVWFVAHYNRFVRLRNHIRESWSDVDVELKRRHDLVPNLVATVKGYAAHEKEVFERVLAARTRAMAPHQGTADLAADESALQHGLKRLVAVSEAYPMLRSDAHFRELMDDLSLTEDRIAAARRFYNGNVRDLNSLCEMFPSSVVAGIFGFRPAEFFELESAAERVAPRV